MDKILITDLLARGIIGVTEDERRRPQDILINLVLELAKCEAVNNDDLTATVDYSDVVKEVMQLVETSQRQTVEAIAGDIAALCLGKPLVERVRVRVEKPNRVRFTRLVGIEIEREKTRA